MKDARRAQYPGCKDTQRAEQAARAMAKAIELEQIHATPECATCDGFRACDHLAHKACRAAAGAARHG